MKVLEPGPGWSLKVRCTGNGNGGGGCGALLQIEKEDLYITYHHCYDGSTDTFVTFHCCVCGMETDIDNKDVPYAIKDRLPDKKDWRCSLDGKASGS